MQSLLRLSGLIDTVNRKVGVGVGWLILVMTIVSALNATSRKLFSASSNAFLEIQWYLFAAVFLLAAGYTLLSNEHVRVDIVNTRLPSRLRLWVELLCTALFLLPFALLVLYYGWPYFMLSFSSSEWSLNAGGLILWPVKLLIPAGFLLLFLQGVSQLIKLAAALSGRLEAGPLLDRHSVQEDEVAAVLSRQSGDGGDR
ncbi:MAG TPA: TRAP transporter small permease subunit [Burkholderiales bacterium]|nr:TRAP transporter small permease subunit [Burkholderiales bacterium]